MNNFKKNSFFYALADIRRQGEACYSFQVATGHPEAEHRVRYHLQKRRMASEEMGPTDPIEMEDIMG